MILFPALAGMNRVPLTASTGRYLFPALAGMNRSANVQAMAENAVPRTRGDEPINKKGKRT